MDETWWRNPDQLDPDQQQIVALPLEGSHLVVGPPGCGKTNLLLLRGTYLTRAGYPNIAVITFNRVLREFLASGSDNYPFEPERIQTFRSWAVGLLKANGEPIDTKGQFEVVRARMHEGLKRLAGRVGDELKFDCILIDEAQDYSPDEIQLMQLFAKDIFAVGDNNQRIYEADGSLDHLRTFCNAPPPLRYHYRNGTTICRLADGIMNAHHGGMLDTCNYDEARYPSSVHRHGGLAVSDQVARAIPELQTQLLAYPDEWIGILAPQKADVRTVFELLAASELGDRVQLQLYDDGYEPLDRSRPIIVTTMHSAKGLEFRAAHLIALDTIEALNNHHRVAYTAVTRAKTSLALYHHRPPPGYIERGLVAVSGAPVEKPKLADLFGRAG